MKIQLRVRKADGSVEEYLHTKVIGTINNALACVGVGDIFIAEQLAEAVTYFLYHEQKRRNVTSGEVFSVIKAVLTATNYEDAAVALDEHYFERKLKRSRVEVVSFDGCEPIDAEALGKFEESSPRSRWDKSKIVDFLTTKYNLEGQTARTIASMVEEKVFNMGIARVPAALIKQLILSDTAVVMRAQRQLQTV